MKKLDKILHAQIGYALGGILMLWLMDLKISTVLVNHLVLSMGYLFGFWHRKA